MVSQRDSLLHKPLKIERIEAQNPDHYTVRIRLPVGHVAHIGKAKRMLCSEISS